MGINKNEQVDKDFQDLFLGKNPLGQKVLGKLVDEVCLLEKPEDNEQSLAAQNVVKMILTRCGIGAGMTGLKFVRALAGKKLENLEGEDEESD